MLEIFGFGLITRNSLSTLYLGQVVQNSTFTESIKYNDTNYYSCYNSDVQASEILNNKKGYCQAGMVVGTMPNNGELNYNVSTLEQTIPAGYTSGGTIEASPQTQDDFDECLTISQEILAYKYIGYKAMIFLHLNSSKKMDLGIKVNLSYTYKLKFKDNSVGAYEAYIGTTASNTYFCRNNSTNNLSTSNMTSSINIVPTNPTEAILKFGSSAGNNIWLGSTGQSTAVNADYDIYYLEVYDSENNIINKFIPVMKIADNSLGLLDIINDVLIEY